MVSYKAKIILGLVGFLLVLLTVAHRVVHRREQHVTRTRIVPQVQLVLVDARVHLRLAIVQIVDAGVVREAARTGLVFSEHGSVARVIVEHLLKLADLSEHLDLVSSQARLALLHDGSERLLELLAHHGWAADENTLDGALLRVV